MLRVNLKRKMKESDNTPERVLERYKLSLEERYINPEVFFPAELNQEMITYQNDPEFIKEASSAIEDICAIAGDGNIKLAKKEGKEYLTALERILQKRFNIGFVLGHNSFASGFCVPFGSKLKFNHNDYIDYADTIVKLDKAKLDPSQKDLIEGKTERDNENTRAGMKGAYEWYKTGANDTMFAFLDQVRKEGLEIDIKTAKIVNAPKGMKFYINLDWFTYKEYCKMNGRELLAVMMHELGHCWTHLLYCYKVFSNIQVLNDVIREEYSKRNKTSVETIKIFYNKTGLPETKSTTKNMAELTIKAYKDILRGSSIGLVSNHSTTDSEQQADEFSSRMGLGADLISALDKIGVNGRQNRYDYIGDQLTYMAIWVYCPALGLALSGGVVAALGLAGLAGMILIWLGIVSLGPENMHGKQSWITYDDAYMRYKRVRNTMVRRLAFIEEKEVKEEILDNIDAVDRLYKKVLKATESSMWKKISDALCKDSVQFDEVKVDEMFEALTANEIYVAQARLEKRS